MSVRFNPKSKGSSNCKPAAEASKPPEKPKGTAGFLERICSLCFSSCHTSLSNNKANKAANSSNSKEPPALKCASPGVVTRNPFLNYLREYRKTHCGVPMTQIAIEGGKCWNDLSDEDKWPYIVEAFRARKRRRSLSHVTVGKPKRRTTKTSRKC